MSLEKKMKNEQMSSQFVMVFRIVIILAIVVLAYLTLTASIQFGLLGFFQQALQNSATTQIFIDLIISISLILVWMWFDSKKHNRRFLPWLFISLAIGSFGPLFYLLLRKCDQF